MPWGEENWSKDAIGRKTLSYQLLFKTKESQNPLRTFMIQIKIVDDE